MPGPSGQEKDPGASGSPIGAAIGGGSLGNGPSIGPTLAREAAGVGLPIRSKGSEAPSEQSPIERFADRLAERSIFKLKGIPVLTMDSAGYLTFEDLVGEISKCPVTERVIKEIAHSATLGIIPIMQEAADGSLPGLTLAISSSNPKGTEDIRSTTELARHFEEYFFPRVVSYKTCDPSKLKILVLEKSVFAQVHGLYNDTEARNRLLKTLDTDAAAEKIYLTITRVAIELGASDIHIEPFREGYRIRFRVDGVLHTRYQIDAARGVKLTSLIKIRADLKVDEKHMPQDGRIFPDRKFDPESVAGKTEKKKGGPILADVDKEPILKGWSMRVSTTPTQGHDKAEKTVMRMLKQVRPEELSLEALGLSPTLVARLREVTAAPSGLLLVTGPTGSGKTTTLYSMLQELSTEDVNISTAEDPVEVRIDGLNQVQVNRGRGLDFPDILRSFMRQDPDIILVGEVRDQATAQIAIQAAQTGHLVLATLHTNDSFGTVTRLEGLGVDRDLIRATLTAVLSQRLVRSLCEECKIEYKGGEHLNAIFGEELFDPNLVLHNPKEKARRSGPACACCNGLGYKGRIAVAELWVPTQPEKELILKGENDPQRFLEIASQHGMVSMVEHALALVVQGKTTIHEVLNNVCSLDQLIASKAAVMRVFNRASH